MSTNRQPPSVRREQTDGRAERRARTQRAIIAAHIDLVRAGSLKPTAATIAESAGVSVRTLWAAFGDREGLLRATRRYLLEVDDEQRTNVDPALPLGERIEAFCTERQRRLEHLMPVLRATELRLDDSHALRAGHRAQVQRFVDDVERIFGAELDALPDRDAAFDAIISAASWSAWAMLRDDVDRSPDEARAAMTFLLTAILGFTP